jgi:hypothetical protein
MLPLPHEVLRKAARDGRVLSLAALQLTFRVAEPEALARHLRFSANGVTARGLGEVSAANGAGNPVLCAVGILQVYCIQLESRWFCILS